MNLTQEFTQAETWIKDVMNATEMMYPFGKGEHSESRTLSFGGLVSTYGLTGGKHFLEKAQEMATVIRTKTVTQIGLDHQKGSFNIHADYIWPRLAFHYYDHLLNESLSGEYPAEEFEKLLQDETPDRVFFHTHGRSFAIKIKSYLQSGSQDGALYRQYLDHFEACKADGRLIDRPALGIAYSYGNTTIPITYSKYCSFGANLALAATAMPRALGNVTSWRLLDPNSPKDAIVLSSTIDHWRLAEAWTQTCIQLIKSTATGLPPEYFNLNRNGTEWLISSQGTFSLESDDAESLFTLWRLTGKEEYREEAWRLALAINKYARAPELGPGFFSTDSVNTVPVEHSNMDQQRPEFLSGTLQYLYLTFREDSLFPLDKWVFDAMGHPFPVCGTHERYPPEICK